MAMDRAYMQTTGLLPPAPIQSWLALSTPPSPTCNGLDGSVRYRPVSDDERAAVAAIKVAIAGIYDPVKHNDAMLLRFAVGMQLDVERATAALEKAIAWKNRNAVDRMWHGPLTDGEAAFSRYHVQMWHGVDHDGHPVFFDRIGRSDRKQFFRAVTDVDVSFWYARAQEVGLVLAQDVTSATGRHVDSLTFVFDLDGMGVTDAANPNVVAMFQTAVSLMQNVYVGSLHRLLIINAPVVFSGVWRVLVNFIDAQAQKKMEVLGSRWRQRLLEIVPASSLPRYLQGSCRHCPGDECIALPARAPTPEPEKRAVSSPTPSDLDGTIGLL
ncbi:unnamed protein product (mitochondrion) [Plasmodiophora brassicae]|uniref:CRAL-TRIO domain-containing protein n=1 Tax=Plasmodiophora brassicae TaxID=37360 RepID=A0A0G4IHM2_PLABS|nr:hypothetical protein PBRA_000512 [Plasmodiophora brassicae]SPQ93015.1 unnamed protein product [Plasmodiophora brassicae]